MSAGRFTLAGCRRWGGCAVRPSGGRCREARTLAATLAEIEFVQADPIQAPASAQDLILRQRVRGYRVGDLDRHYPALDVDRAPAGAAYAKALDAEIDRLRAFLTQA
jgi:hypothetical protein